jgi:hypothetical protein
MVESWAEKPVYLYLFFMGKQPRFARVIKTFLSVQWSTWPQAEPSFSAQPLEASLMFSAIARALH